MQLYDKLIDQIKSGKIAPFYLLSGTEPYFIDSISNYIVSKLISESARDFDFSILYGKDTSVNEIIETAKRYPMIADHHLVLIREAQYLEKKYDELSKYLLNHQKQSVVVFCYKNKLFDRRSRLFKAAASIGAVYESKPLYENQIGSWISSQLKNDDLEASQKAIQLLIEFLGSDLGKIKQEISKLKILCSDKLITPELVEKYIGISKDFNNFELIKAIGAKNKNKSIQIIFYLSNNSKNNPLVLTISSLFQFFKKLLLFHGISGSRANVSSTLGVNPYFIKDYEIASKLYNMKSCSYAINIIHIADLKSKGIIANNESHKETLIDLINEIFNI